MWFSKETELLCLEILATFKCRVVDPDSNNLFGSGYEAKRIPMDLNKHFME